MAASPSDSEIEIAILILSQYRYGSYGLQELNRCLDPESRTRSHKNALLGLLKIPKVEYLRRGRRAWLGGGGAW
jgi:hypothetical protein